MAFWESVVSCARNHHFCVDLWEDKMARAENALWSRRNTFFRTVSNSGLAICFELACLGNVLKSEQIHVGAFVLEMHLDNLGFPCRKISAHILVQAGTDPHHSVLVAARSGSGLGPVLSKHKFIGSGCAPRPFTDGALE